jgi:hypothetical protein
MNILVFWDAEQGERLWYSGGSNNSTKKNLSHEYSKSIIHTVSATISGLVIKVGDIGVARNVEASTKFLQLNHNSFQEPFLKL